MEGSETKSGPDFGRRARCGRPGGGGMTITRFLPGVLIAVATAGPATAQYGSDSSADRYGGLVPSVSPVGYTESTPPPGTRVPTGRPAAAANGTALDRVTTPVRQTA